MKTMIRATDLPHDGQCSQDFVEWRISRELVDYDQALESMRARAAAVRAGDERELIWLLEHPPLLTAGTSADPAELLDKERFPVYEAGRGGRFTYHGPGQRVVYCVLDLDRRGRDIRALVHRLEEWIIATLANFGVRGERREGRVGIWVVDEDGGEAKIAALGIRVRKWVTFHGLSINVYPDLEHFGAIVPCGLAEFGVTSLRALGVDATMDDVDRALRETFNSLFDIVRTT